MRLRAAPASRQGAGAASAAGAASHPCAVAAAAAWRAWAAACRARGAAAPPWARPPAARAQCLRGEEKTERGRVERQAGSGRRRRLANPPIGAPAISAPHPRPVGLSDRPWRPRSAGKPQNTARPHRRPGPRSRRAVPVPRCPCAAAEQPEPAPAPQPGLAARPLVLQRLPTCFRRSAMRKVLAGCRKQCCGPPTPSRQPGGRAESPPTAAVLPAALLCCSTPLAAGARPPGSALPWAVHTVRVSLHCPGNPSETGGKRAGGQGGRVGWARLGGRRVRDVGCRRWVGLLAARRRWRRKCTRLVG